MKRNNNHKNKIRVFLVDDHEIVRVGLRQILEKGGDDLVVVGEAENGIQALERIKETDIDVLLMDIEMPEKSGWEVLKTLKALRPDLPILILSIFPEDLYGIRLLKEGAAGYLTKNSTPKQFVEAIRSVARGGKYVSPELASQLVDDLKKGRDRQAHDILSEREFQVFNLIASGKKIKDIAKELSISITTVSTHRARILDKMNLENTTDLIRHALKQGLVK